MKEDRMIPKHDKRRVPKPAAVVPTNRTSAAALRSELDLWLGGRLSWSHDDWLTLLSDLRSKGYNDLIDTQKGQEAIGLYLETHRQRSSH